MKTKKITNIFATLSVLQFGFLNNTHVAKIVMNFFCNINYVGKDFCNISFCCKVFPQPCPCCNNENGVGWWRAVQLTDAEAVEILENPPADALRGPWLNQKKSQKIISRGQLFGAKEYKALCTGILVRHVDWYVPCSSDQFCGLRMVGMVLYGSSAVPLACQMSRVRQIHGFRRTCLYYCLKLCILASSTLYRHRTQCNSHNGAMDVSTLKLEMSVLP